MSFAVAFSERARRNLRRLYEYLVDAVQSSDDLAKLSDALDAIEAEMLKHLSTAPFVYRKSGSRSARRELIIPFGSTGYVALFEIVDAAHVVVLAVRHQRERGYS